jgi:hypothetical protein
VRKDRAPLVKRGRVLEFAQFLEQRPPRIRRRSRPSFPVPRRPGRSEELELLKRLDQIFTDYPVYGSRRLQVALSRDGVSVGRRRVRRLMKKLGLWAVRPKRNTSKRHPEHQVYPYLLRGKTIDQPNPTCARRPMASNRSAALPSSFDWYNLRLRIRRSAGTRRTRLTSANLWLRRHWPPDVMASSALNLWTVGCADPRLTAQARSPMGPPVTVKRPVAWPRIIDSGRTYSLDARTAKVNADDQAAGFGDADQGQEYCEHLRPIRALRSTTSARQRYCRGSTRVHPMLISIP